MDYVDGDEEKLLEKARMNTESIKVSKVAFANTSVRFNAGRARNDDDVRNPVKENDRDK